MQEILNQVYATVISSLAAWIVGMCWAHYRRIKRIRKDLNVAFNMIREIREELQDARDSEDVGSPKSRCREGSDER